MRAAATAGCRLLAALLAVGLVWPMPSTAAPERVVSVNVCTDQLAMLVAAPGQLIAVSHLARDPNSSAMTEVAHGYAVTNGQAEAVFQLQPDLVLAGVYTTSVTVRLLEQLGVRVERFASATDIASIAADLRRMGKLLGREAEAESLAAVTERRAAALQADALAGRKPRAAFLDANSYTAGQGTLLHSMIEAAGMRNIAAERGLSHTARLPLETLVLAKPDLLLVAQRYAAPSMGEAVLDHPALRTLASGTGRVEIGGAVSTCGTPATLAAVEELAAARRAMLAVSGADD